MTLEIVEQPSAGFTLRTSEGAVALPKPILRALYVQDPDTASKRADHYAAEDVEDLEARVRESEAGLRWIQGQLSSERDRRRALEQEVEALRAKNEGLRAEPERLASLEVEVSELRLEREKRKSLEEAVATLTADRDRLKALEPDANLVAEERARREALEKQLAEFAVDREHMHVLEEKVKEMVGELKEAHEATEAAKEADAQGRSQLIDAKAAGDATISRLKAELQAARKVRGGGREEAVEEPRVEEPVIEEPVDLSESGDEPELAVEVAEPERPLDEDAQPAVTEPATGAVPCVACDATGSCHKCHGKGKKLGLRCSECDGSGLCAVCGGPGYVWEDDGESDSPAP
jgi:hypothetical protein